jgi:hypothetical protein
MLMNSPRTNVAPLFDRNIPRLLQPAMLQPMQGGSSPRRQRRKKWVSQFIAASQVAAEKADRLCGEVAGSRQGAGVALQAPWLTQTTVTFDRG